MLLRFDWFWILGILPEGCLCKALSQDPAGASKSPHQSFKYKKIKEKKSYIFKCWYWEKGLQNKCIGFKNWRSKKEEAATLKKGSWKKSSLTTVTTSFPQSAEAILSNWNDLNLQRLQYPQSPQTAILRPRSPPQLPKGLKPLTAAWGAFLRWARLRETFLRMCLSHLRGSDTEILTPILSPKPKGTWDTSQGFGEVGIWHLWTTKFCQGATKTGCAFSFALAMWGHDP